MSECIPVAKVCDNCGCYESCIYANPRRKQDCALWKPDMSWVPVSERLPEQGQEVIVASYRMIKPVVFTTIFWNKEHDNWYGITHWMPLPRPPKEATDV